MGQVPRSRIPKVNFCVERLKLQITQGSDTFDEFVTSLKLQAQRSCKFDNDNAFNERVLEQIIAGCRSSKLQKDLLAKDASYTLSDAIEHGRLIEANKQHSQEMQKIQGAQRQERDSSCSLNAIQNKRQGQCKKCGTSQSGEASNCPAKGSE